MAISSDNVRLTVMVSRETAKQIEELAEAMRTTTSAMCASLLREAVNDNAWIIKRIAAPLRKLLEKRERRARPASE